MSTLFLGIFGLVCAAVWLVLLVVTGFNLLTISAGLLGGLYVTGVKAGDTSRQSH